MSNFSIFLSAEVADEAKPILVTVIVCLFVFLVLILLTLFFSQKIISVPWIERSEKLWKS